MSDQESARRLQELLARLEEALTGLEQSDQAEEAVDRLAAMAELAREVQGEIDRLRRETPDAPA
jgi:hypothetical protein